MPMFRITPPITDATPTPWRATLPRSLPPAHARWLQTTGSLTRALQTLGTVDVTVVREGLIRSARPAAALGAAFRGPVWARDVLLSVDGARVIAARSVAHARDSRAAWKAMRTLGTRPLASILYSDSEVTRGPFAFAPFRTSRTGVSGGLLPEQAGIACWGRASVFERQHAPLIVTELFLPALWAVLDRTADPR